MSIQSLGIGSGLLTSELVEDIVSAERESTDLRIDARKAEIEAKISAFGSVKSTLDGLRSAAGALGSASSLLANIATSSNPNSVMATATSEAAVGVHSVEVAALARSHTLASVRFDDITSVVGNGTLDFRFGTTTFKGNGKYDSFTENPDRQVGSIVIDDSNNTVAGIRDAINEAGIGVTASIVNDGQGYLLVLTSEESGADNSMEITATEGAVPGLSALAFNEDESKAGVNLTQTVVAEDAVVAIDGIQITRDTNDIEGVIEGVSFDLLSVNVGAPAIVSVEQDTAGVLEKVQSFIDRFNDVRVLTEELTKFDEESESGSLLIGDSTLRNVRSQLRRMMAGSVVGLDSQTMRGLVDLGISTNQNNSFLLELNSSKLLDALRGDPGSVQGLLASQKQASDSLIEFLGFQNATRAGSFDVKVSQIATRGSLLGATVAGLAGPITIDADNDDLSVSVNGVASAGIQLGQGVYADGAALAAEIETRINADANLSAAGVDVSVQYNLADGRLEIRSARFGSSSIVGVTAVDTDTLAQLGLDVSDGEAGRGVDVGGQVNGIDGKGNGQFLSVPTGPIPASAGYIEAKAITGFDAPPLTLDGSNNTFAVAVDSIGSGTITLTPGDYASGAALATEIALQINADAALTAAGASVEVAFDQGRKMFTLTSKSTGTTSNVSFTTVPAATEAALGFGVAMGTPGRNATRVTDPAGGIQLKVLGGAVGERGDVTLVRGLMNQIDRFLDDALSFDGTFNNKIGSLEAQLADLDQEKTDFDTRMNALEARLRTQFAATDALISQLNSTSEFLSNQLSALPSFNSKD